MAPFILFLLFLSPLSATESVLVDKKIPDESPDPPHQTLYQANLASVTQDNWVTRNFGYEQRAARRLLRSEKHWKALQKKVLLRLEALGSNNGMHDAFVRHMVGQVRKEFSKPSARKHFMGLLLKEGFDFRDTNSISAHAANAIADHVFQKVQNDDSYIDWKRSFDKEVHKEHDRMYHRNFGTDFYDTFCGFEYRERVPHLISRFQGKRCAYLLQDGVEAERIVLLRRKFREASLPKKIACQGLKVAEGVFNMFREAAKGFIGAEVVRDDSWQEAFLESETFDDIAAGLMRGIGWGAAIAAGVQAARLGLPALVLDTIKVISAAGLGMVVAAAACACGAGFGAKWLCESYLDIYGPAAWGVGGLTALAVFAALVLALKKGLPRKKASQFDAALKWSGSACKLLGLVFGAPIGAYLAFQVLWHSHLPAELCVLTGLGALLVGGLFFYPKVKAAAKKRGWFAKKRRLTLKETGLLGIATLLIAALVSFFPFKKKNGGGSDDDLTDLQNRLRRLNGIFVPVLTNDNHDQELDELVDLTRRESIVDVDPNDPDNPNVVL